MTLLFFEGFETVGTDLLIANQATAVTRVSQRWDAVSAGGVPSSDSFFLINDIFSEGYAIQMGSNGFSNGNYLQFRPLPTTTTGATAAEYILGFRAHIPSTSRTWNIAQIRSVANNNPHLHITVTNSADISVSRNLGGSFFSGSGVLTAGSWHYIELRFIIGNSPYGEVELLVDGVQIGETLSTDTQDFFGHVDSFRLQTTNASSGEDYVGFDDIYLLEVDATAPNDFIGSSSRVVSLPPNGDDTSEWTTSGGTVHYSLIDENGASDSDFIRHATDLEEDLFDCSNITAGGEVFAIKVEVEAIAVIEDTHSIDVICKSVAAYSQTNHNVDDLVDYEVFVHYQMTDPNTGSAWTNSGVDAMVVGVEYNT